MGNQLPVKARLVKLAISEVKLLTDRDFTLSTLMTVLYLSLLFPQ